MLNLEKTYCALVYFLFLVLFIIVYAENVTAYQSSHRAFVVAIAALAGMVFNTVLIYRVLRRGMNSRLVSMNNVVSTWTMYKLGYRQRFVSAAVNLVSMAVFVFVFWCFKHYLAGMVFTMAALGYEASEILRPRFERINFWVFSFTVPVFIFIVVFVFLIFFGGLQ